MEQRTEIREFLDKLLRRREEAPEFADDEPLISSGRLPSLAVVELLIFLEERFGISFASRPFDPASLDSVDKILEILTGWPSA